MPDNAEYDAFSTSYAEWISRVQYIPLVETHTLFDIMIMPGENGSLIGKRALDLACGEGHYTRMLRDRGCTHVTGIDTSQRMIDIARQREADDSIDYLCTNCVHLPSPTANEPCYDLITAAHLLHYARTRDELRCMVQGIFERLKLGGRFYSINHNVTAPFNIMLNNEAYRKYGLVKYADNMEKPYAIDVKPINPDTGEEMGFSFTNYHLAPELYESVFTEIGFREFRWVPVQINEKAGVSTDFWRDYMRAPFIVGITATK